MPPDANRNFAPAPAPAIIAGEPEPKSLRRKLIALLLGGVAAGSTVRPAEAATWQSVKGSGNPVVGISSRIYHVDQGGNISGIKFQITYQSGATGYFYHSYSTNCDCNCTCVPAGTLVNTPQGKVPIETLQVGMAVQTSRGSALIMQLWRPQLGTRILWRVNGQLDITGDHLIKTTNGWACIEPKAFGYRQKLGLAPSANVLPLQIGDQLLTDTGAQRIISIEALTAPADTQLYSLFVSAEAEFFANGILVDGINTPSLEPVHV